LRADADSHAAVARRRGASAERRRIVSCRLTAGTDPLVLDLDGNGLDLVRRDASNVYFDIDSDGFAEKTGWLSGNDGFLARDLNGNGLIDDISEMFGNATTQGFAALGALDANADGKITAADTAFTTLRVWRDLNGNGRTDAGELQTLAEAGITQISLASGTPAIGEVNGNVVRATAGDRKRRRTGRRGRPDCRARWRATMTGRPDERRAIFHMTLEERASRACCRTVSAS
jgi:hypothetical protein